MSTQLAEPSQRTYGQIIKSSILVGSSSAANIVIGVARAKVMAVLLGPSGVGLAGLYNAIADLTSMTAGLGVNSSGVRQIAAAASSENIGVIACTTTVLRRVSLILGLIGALLLTIFSGLISTLTFGSDRYRSAICLLSIGVFFRLVSAGQTALIQGMRRIADLAKIGVWGSFLGTVVTVFIIFLLRENGIVLSIICGGAISLLISWIYSRKLRVASLPMKLSEIAGEVNSLLKLGVAFMFTGLMTMGSAYMIRIIILRDVGLEAAGLYQSAWTIGGLYVGFILQAMSADFYPRLTASVHDHVTCNRLVNEQAYIGLLLGGPGVLATLSFAPLVITAFYTAKFYAAVQILRWLCLGTMLQVVSWPMGFIILAKGRQDLFLLSDFAWSIAYIGFAWIFIKAFGLNGVGIAFFASYIFHILLTYPIVKHLSGFRWSRESKRTGGLFLCAIASVFCGLYLLPYAWASGLGILSFFITSLYSLRILACLVPINRLPGPLRLLVRRFGATAYDSFAS